MRTLPSTKFRPYRAIVAGFCAATVATIILLFSHIFAQILAKGAGEGSPFYALAYNNLTQSVSQNVFLTTLAHFVLGVAFAMAYAKSVDRLPGHNNWKSGLTFGLALWLLSAVVFFPVVGAGFFGMGLGAGILPVAGSLVLHMAYGLTLGTVYSPALARMGVNVGAQHAIDAEGHALDFAPGAPNAEKSAALGILGGSAVGAAVAGVIWMATGPGTSIVPGLPLDYALMAVIFFCVGVGLLIGFWTGVPDPRPARGATRAQA